MRWTDPPPRYLKLNVDGGFRDGHGTYNGLHRNEKGYWQWGFAGAAATEGPLHAEILALKVGLQMLIDRGLSQVIWRQIHLRYFISSTGMSVTTTHTSSISSLAKTSIQSYGVHLYYIPLVFVIFPPTIWLI